MNTQAEYILSKVDSLINWARKGSDCSRYINK